MGAVLINPALGNELITNDILTRNPDLVAIFAANDQTAIGAPFATGAACVHCRYAS